MGCRCNERAAAMVRTVKAIGTGDAAEAAAQVQFITKSAVEDVATTVRSQMLAARSRLAMMRRR